MAIKDERKKYRDHVNSVLKDCCQGDFILSEQKFFYLSNANLPITKRSASATNLGENILEKKVSGLVILSNTCDIVSCCVTRPYVEVAPLRKVNKNMLSNIKIAISAQYAYIPNLANQELVADLAQVMTVEKSVVAGWERKKGCSSDKEKQAFAAAAGRKRSRAAFPNNFNKVVEKLQEKLDEKPNEETEEGNALRKLREIRVRVKAWNDDHVELTFFFIHDNNLELREFHKSWMALFTKNKNFQKFDIRLITLERLRAKEYVESVPLDLDYLSPPASEEE